MNSQKVAIVGGVITMLSVAGVTALYLPYYVADQQKVFSPVNLHFYHVSYARYSVCFSWQS